jgi:hypothetical protein
METGIGGSPVYRSSHRSGDEGELKASPLTVGRCLAQLFALQEHHAGAQAPARCETNGHMTDTSNY